MEITGPTALNLVAATPPLGSTACSALGEVAYMGEHNTQLNPPYFKFCDAIVKQAAARNLYVVIYAMWAGAMNHYTADQRLTGPATDCKSPYKSHGPYTFAYIISI